VPDARPCCPGIHPYAQSRQVFEERAEHSPP
jgi:hypothetical protein